MNTFEFEEWIKTEGCGDVEQLERAWRAGKLSVLREEKVAQVIPGMGGDERPFLVILTTHGRVFSGPIHGQGGWEETELPNFMEKTW